jgi:chromosome partitioning protein
MIAKKHRVLLVDADSQCNLSSLILADDFERYYLEALTSKQNIKDGVAPAFEARPVPITPLRCTSPPRAPNLYLLAGHADLSAYDGALTLAQMSNNAISTLQNLPGAFAPHMRTRISCGRNWCMR